MASDAYLEIGAFSERVGVSADLLRAWERRYGLPRPVRTPNGRRLYSRADEQIVKTMRRALAQGVRAAEAARLARGEADGTSDTAAAPELAALGSRLRAALDDLDDTRAQKELDHLFGTYSADTALAQVILPYLSELGERWACAELGVGDEHFASNLISGRLLGLARRWDDGDGQRALLACPPGEQHTMGLLCFGLALRMHGWRITYLGADTPTDAIAQVAESVLPAQIVLASVSRRVFRDAADQLTDLARRMPLAVAGAGAGPQIATALGARLLPSDPVTEAARLAASG
jgi:DNA-binding transcriptional MerR regulator